MKKDKLIELLNSIEGNPDIMLWNGFVEDVVDINKNITKDTLYKLKKSFIEEYSAANNITDVKGFLKNNKFEYRNYEPDVLDIYDTKDVYILQSKVAGKTYSDRLGKMSY